MNPYRAPPDQDRDVAPLTTGKPVHAANEPVQDADELRRRQMRLVIRLLILSVVTSLGSFLVVAFAGFSLIPTAITIALILGIGFTISWRV